MVILSMHAYKGHMSGPIFVRFFIQHNMRALGPGSETYTEWLRCMSSTAAFFGTIELPQYFTVVYTLKERLFSVFSQHRLIPVDNNYQWYARRAILALLNQIVKKINLKLLKEFGSPEHKLYAIDKADVSNQDEGVYHTPAEVLRAQESGIISP